jgi:hypothetical protein
MHHFAETAGRSGVRQEIGRYLPRRAIARDEVLGPSVVSDAELVALELTAIRRLTR